MQTTSLAQVGPTLLPYLHFQYMSNTMLLVLSRFFMFPQFLSFIPPA